MDKNQESSRPLIKRQPFPAGNDFYRAARTRCSIACREYNNQPENATSENRARLWNAIVSPVEPTEPPGTSPALTLHQTFTGLVFEIDSNTTTSEASASTNIQVMESTALPTSPGLYHLSETHQHHDLHGAKRKGEMRLGPSVQIHSTPPSPGSSLLLTRTPNADNPAASAPAVTLPASRRAISADILGCTASNHDQDIVVEAPLANPFRVNVPYIKPPLFIDYGTNLRIGASTFINRNFTVLDSPIARVSIGEGCLIGPNTTLASITHPLDAAERAAPLGAPSFASEISIGDNCWIGASVNILDGVKIGNGCVIGAGSVVTKDIPAGHLAFGVPARAVRRVTSDPADRQLAFVEAAHGTNLSSSDPLDVATDVDICACRGSDHQIKHARLEKKVVVLSVVVAVLAVKCVFG